MGNTSSTQDSNTNTNAIDEKKKKIEVMKEEIKKEIEVLENETTKEIGVVEKDKKKKMEVTEEEIKKKMAVVQVLEKMLEMIKKVEGLKEEKKKIDDLEEELKKKIEVLEEEIKSAMSETKKGQFRGAETRKSKPSRSQDSQRAVLSMRQGVGMGPSSKREVKKEETGSGGTFEERRVDALEGLAESVEKLVRIVMAVLMM